MKFRDPILRNLFVLFITFIIMLLVVAMFSASKIN